MLGYPTHPVVDFAHSLLLPPGPLKDKINKLVEGHFQKFPGNREKAQQALHPYLAASIQYAKWEWNPAIGLVKIKGGKSK
jgi:hypothetical protein